MWKPLYSKKYNHDLSRRISQSLHYLRTTLNTDFVVALLIIKHLATTLLQDTICNNSIATTETTNFSRLHRPTIVLGCQQTLANIVNMYEEGCYKQTYNNFT